MKHDLSKVKELQSEIKKLKNENLNLRLGTSNLNSNLSTQELFCKMSHEGFSYDDAMGFLVMKLSGKSMN